MRAELSKLVMIPMFMREMMEEILKVCIYHNWMTLGNMTIKETDVTKKATLMFNLEKSLLEENTN